MRFFFLALTAMASVPASAFAAGDPAVGAAVFKKCAACHTATEPGNKVGPSLMGVVGRKVASVPDYAYSSAMTAFADGGKVWDEALLAAYLPYPQGLVNGTKMTFLGLKKDQDIADLIAYLKSQPAAQ